MTTLLLPFREHVNPTEVALVLLLAVLFSASLFGSRAGLAASIAGMLCFNFFFLPPFHTFTIAGPENWVAFATFLVTALIAGQLSGYARRRAEESEQRQKEIERLYTELKDAFEQASEAEALRRSEKLKSSLLDAVTHDLRTPLTAIKASATTLLEDGHEADLDEESRTELLQVINEEADRLDDFVEGMVGIAKIEAGALHLRKKFCSVEEIIDNAIGRGGRQLSGHSIEKRIEGDLPAVFVDAASVAEVVFTLLDNAARYSAKGTTIRISARETHKAMVEIAVADQGKGIEPRQRNRVFDKFYRAGEQDIHTTGGLGLGLSIARGIVESQGGTIRIEDGSEGFATRVVFELPCLGETKPEPENGK